jgi:hypothetical protein
MITDWNAHRDKQVLDHELYDHPFWRPYIIETAEVASTASSDEFDRDSNIRRGFGVVEAAVEAVTPDWWARSGKQTPNGWYHRSLVSLAGKPRGDPYIMRVEVEGVAAAYLKLGYRVPLLDRLLTDMLMAAEVLTFADEMQPQLKRKLPPVLAWLWGNVVSLVAGLGIAGILVWFAPNSRAMWWVAGIIAGLTLLGAVYSLVVFPFFYPGIRKQRQKFAGTVMSMIDAYSTLGGSPASVPHIRKMVERATDAGVVWPAPLMALLDDIAERRKAI